MQNFTISTPSRRRFLKAAGATALVTYGFPALGATGANDRVRLELIGCGWRGGQLFKQFHRVKNIEFVGLSDPDTENMEKVAAMAKGNQGAKLIRYRDYRTLLEQADTATAIPSASSTPRSNT